MPRARVSRYERAMNFTRTLSLVSLTALVALTVGCFSPYLKRAANVPEPKPSPAVVAGFVVRFDAGMQEKSLLDAAIDAAQNSMLAEFGTSATDLLKERMAQYGYTVAFDQPRSAKLDAVQLSSNAGTAALTGQWRHPEASYWTPDMVDSLFVKPSDIVSKIKTDQKEFFGFADVVIRDTGIILKEPTVIVKVAVYDQDAKKVLDLGGIGSGASSIFVSDRSPNNLKIALTKAFESLAQAKEESL
jgi:hypothetical protein